MFGFALELLAFLLGVLLLVLCRIRGRKAPPPVETKARPSWWRGSSAVVVDVNNVRGALHFEWDLVAMCGACCGVATRDSPLLLFVDHGPRPCAVATDSVSQFRVFGFSDFRVF